MKKNTLLSLLVLFVLVAAVGFQLFGQASARKNMVPPDLAGLFPREIDGWIVEDRPVADSPEMLETVERILSYDSALFRVYRRGGTEISVYAAYWLPAKIPASHVDAHTPDICWVANGWEMEKADPLPPQSTVHGQVPVPNVRDFIVSGSKLSVIYWHVNGSELRQNTSVWEPTLTSMERIKRRLGQFQNIIFNPPGQQLFVRISTNKKMETEVTSEPVRAGLDLVAKSLSGEILYTVLK